MKREYQSLPRELAAKLLAAERRDTRVMTLQAILGVVLVAGAVFLPFLAMERLWAFPRYLRGAVSLLALIGAGWFVFGWLIGRWRCRRDPFATIRRIERHYPDLGDSLRGVIELAEDDASRTGISESLRQAAVRQVASRCNPLDFGAAISTARIRWYGKWVGAMVVVLTVCAWFEPELLRNAVARFVRPWAEIPRYSFARLESLPDAIHMARGETFSLPVRLAEDSRWRPGQLRFRLGRGERKTCLIEDGQALLELPGITEPAPLRVWLGDTAATVRLEPVPRPALLELSGEASFPDYLERSPETLELSRRRPRLVEGSKMVLHGTVLNPLARAWLGEAGQEFTVEDRVFTSPSLPVETLQETGLNWEDRHGLRPAEPYRVETELAPDAPPSIQFDGVLQVFAILEDEVLELPLVAGDDFGVHSVDVAWEVRPADKGDGPPVTGDRRSLGTGAPDQNRWAGTFVFSPQRLGIAPGNKVTVRGLAVDYKPGRVFSESAPVDVYVLTPEDHARLVENQLAALRNRMEEAALREAQQLLDNEDLARLSDEELRESDAQRTLDRQTELERKSVEDWQRLAAEGAKLLAEASRNESFSDATLAEWTQIMEAVQQVSSELLPTAATSLAQAGQAAEQRREPLEQAIKAQKEALEKLRKSAEKMGDSLDQFAVLNLAARLRALAERERGVGGTIQELFPQTIGMAATDLPPPLGKRVSDLAGTQGDIQKLVFGVQFEVRRCLENTGIEKYELVVKAMEEAKLAEEMPKVQVALSENRLSQAAGEVLRWARSLDEWATLLDEKREGGGGGGGGGGEMSEEAIKFMLALLRAIQEQERIRRDTVGVEAEKSQTEAYARQVARLADAEAELARTVGELAKQLRLSEARNNVEDAQGLMEGAEEMLREPRTGPEVQADMVSAMELLLTLFESNCQGGQCQASAMLSMMAQSLRLGMGSRGGASAGGSRAGGAYGGAGGSVGGGTGSGGGAARSGAGAVDVSPTEFPAEYRGLLERFFQNVEAE